MTSPAPLTRDVLATFEDVRVRLFGRLAGLGDDEYLWEPVPGCMTLRPSPDGGLRADPRVRPQPDPAPVTTIGWRMWHIGADCLRGYRTRFLGDEPPAADPQDWPGTAAAGVRLLAEEWSRFTARIAELGDERLPREMGPQAGPYADESYLLLALHALDEAAHHGAEIALLRDLYRHAR